MDIIVSLQIKITFDGNKKVSVGNVATAVKGLGLEIARPGTSVLAV